MEEETRAHTSAEEGKRQKHAAWRAEKLQLHGDAIRQFLADNPDARELPRTELSQAVAAALGIGAATVGSLWSLGENTFWVSSRSGIHGLVTHPYFGLPPEPGTVPPPRTRTRKVQTDKLATVINLLTEHDNEQKELIADLTQQLADLTEQFTASQQRAEKAEQALAKTERFKCEFYRISEISPHHSKDAHVPDALSVRFVMPESGLLPLFEKLDRLPNGAKIGLVIPGDKEEQPGLF